MSKLFVLVLLVFVFLVYSTPTNCNSGTVSRVLSVDENTLGKVQDCSNRRVCIVRCSKIVPKCKYHNAFFDITTLSTYSRPDFQDPVTGNATSFEKIGYQKTCVERVFTRTGDLFREILTQVDKIAKRRPYARGIVDCTKKFIFYYRALESKCKEKKNWITALKKDIRKFDLKTCTLTGDQAKRFSRIQTPIIEAHLRLAEFDDDVSESKYCNCLEFENFIGSSKKQVILGSKKAKILDIFQQRYYKLHKLMRATCEKRCGVKNHLGARARNIARIGVKIVKEAGFWWVKKLRHRKIIQRIRKEIDNVYGIKKRARKWFKKSTKKTGKKWKKRGFRMLLPKFIRKVTPKAKEIKESITKSKVVAPLIPPADKEGDEYIIKKDSEFAKLISELEELNK